MAVFKTVEDLRLCNLVFLTVLPQMTKALYEKSGEPDKKNSMPKDGYKKTGGQGGFSGEKTSALRGGV